ncbi:MAG: hypothetical protein VKK80_14530 [Prochlorothrix sp.]|nr:hypothetical protein [Prochlorothrix sp.]
MSNLIVLIAALVIAWLIFTWVLNVLKATLTTAFVVAIIAAALSIIVGIGPSDLFNQVLNLPQTLLDLVRGQ